MRYIRNHQLHPPLLFEERKAIMIVIVIIVVMMIILIREVVKFDCLQSSDNKYFGRVKL